MQASMVSARGPGARLVRTAVATAIGAGAMFSAFTAHALIVYSGPVSLAIPASTNGLYLNVVTGANNLPPPGTGGTTVSGWDINPWSATGLGFFNPASPAGGVYVISAANFVANLGAASIGPASLFGSGAPGNTAMWALNSSANVFGFRFTNEPGGTLHYGWARIAIGSTITSRTLVEYAFESTPNTAIMAGAVPEPSTYAMFAFGLLGLLAARRRLQR